MLFCLDLGRSGLLRKKNRFVETDRRKAGERRAKRTGPAKGFAQRRIAPRIGTVAQLPASRCWRHSTRFHGQSPLPGLSTAASLQVQVLYESELPFANDLKCEKVVNTHLIHP